MKLRNSIDALDEAYTDMNNAIPNLHALVGDTMGSAIKAGKVKNPEKYASYLIWWAMSSENRQAIIAQSIPLDTWVGGHAPDLHDTHIDTLLRNSLIHQFVCTVLLDYNIPTLSNTLEK
jgi:hypothetical protein